MRTLSASVRRDTRRETFLRLSFQPQRKCVASVIESTLPLRPIGNGGTPEVKRGHVVFPGPQVVNECVAETQGTPHPLRVFAQESLIAPKRSRIFIPHDARPVPL